MIKIHARMHRQYREIVRKLASGVDSLWCSVTVVVVMYQTPLQLLVLYYHSAGITFQVHLAVNAPSKHF